MSKSIKCIIRQGWTNRNAAGELLERRDYVYVTDEDGAPHIYNSISEARAEIRANFGRDVNKAGIIHTHHTDDYTGNTHEGYAFIVREDTEEYAKATKKAETAEAVEAVDFISRATDDHRETVADMLEAIADAARDDAAARLEYVTSITPDMSAYAGLEYLELEPAPRLTYERYELETYLGEPDAYDLEAIEAEATEYDPRTGRTVWAQGIDLAAIAERHELITYAAI